MNLKRLVRNAAAAALTLVMVTGIASAAFGTGVVTEGPLRIRASASTSSKVLGNAPKGAKVEVLENAGNGWYKISYKGKTGFMSASYLNVTPSAEQAAPAEEEPVPLAAEPAEAVAAELEEAPEGECARVTTSSLNIRSGPGTSYEKVGSLRIGSIVDVISRSDEWAKIQCGSVEGYVSCDYVSFGTREELEAANSAGQNIVDIAKQYLGTPYVYGGTTPSGFDCSGFVYYVYKQAGRSVPRLGTSMWNKYTHVSKSELQPGDVVCFTNTGGSSRISHVGLYVGNNIFIHSSSPSSGGVIYTSLSENYYATRYVGACRPLA